MARKIGMEQLVKALARLGIDIEEVLGEIETEEDAKWPRNPAGEKQSDYVAYGSIEHANLLGLELVNGKDLDESTPTVTDKDGRRWRLANQTYSALIELPQFDMDKIRLIHSNALAQKVSELTAPIPKTQSRDPRGASFAPTMWDPGTDVPFAKQTEEE